MNKNLIIIAVVIVAALVIAYFWPGDNPALPEDNPTPLGTYFQNQLVSLAVQRVGQPIEGFDANLLMMSFPGLVVSDFQNVETVEGYYKIENNQAILVRREGAPITSAERMVSAQGYTTLLQNVSSRLILPANTEAEVDTIITKLSTTTQATTTPAL